jgi:hypothetical protein
MEGEGGMRERKRSLTEKMENGGKYNKGIKISAFVKKKKSISLDSTNKSQFSLVYINWIEGF